jgi:NAD(P)-dependent dehydrogenase (short-subunit alcohol dehydrogenase family)
MSSDSRLIVVTGVSRGLGRAMAEAFMQLGHTVVGCARNFEQVRALQRAWPSPHRVFGVDVSKDTQVAIWAREVLEEIGTPDLLLNNAAVINRNAPLWKVPAEEFDTLMQVNVIGVTNVLRHFLPSMIERQSGVIVNFSSGWGRSVSADVAPYCASKWAIEGLTQALAEELPEGMAAVPLNPGIINTDMLASCFGANAESYPTAEQWAARAVPFLLSLSAEDNGRPLSVH